MNTNTCASHVRADFCSLIILAGVIQFSSTATAQTGVAIGNPNAPQGGIFTLNLQAEPATLNPITGTDLYNQKIKLYTIDSLMVRGPDTYEWMPALAEKAETSKDGKTFTFTLRAGAKFHDGKPVTAEDVKFSFDVIFDPQYNAAHMRPYYENIDKAEIVDPRTVRFTAKTPYFGNFNVLADLSVVPKHIYGDSKSGSKKNKNIIGSGPYKLEKYDQGQSIVLVKNKEWWGSNVPEYKGIYNFERIRMRFIKDENIGIESLKKGVLDFEAFTPEAFMKKTDGPEWGKSVLKKQVENLAPKSYGYYGWNLRKDLFQDRDVRLALSHLMNREELNKKFRFGMSQLATGPWYQQSEYADPSVKPILFDPKKAVELLRKAGWADTDKNGVLDKVVNGQKREFSFTLFYGSKDTEKYHVLYQGDLKKVGIDMQLQQLEWNALIKSIDEFNFDVVAMGWGAGSVDLDPKQIWHSQSAARGGSNFIGYNNPEVDKLIDQARAETDKKKRIPILRKVYSMIAADVPYTFWFNERYVLYGHSAKLKLPKDTFKYEVGMNYWWFEK